MSEPAWRVGLAEGHVGDARAVLAALPAESVHLAITSPPFFALRRYSGEQGVIWGGDKEHAHDWQERTRYWDNRHAAMLAENGNDHLGSKADGARWTTDRSCACGAILCALGLEKTPDCLGWARGENCRRCFICHLREIFAHVWRVLRRDGVCVIEIGDSYSGHVGYSPNAPSNLAGSLQANRNGARGQAQRNTTLTRVAPGLREKNLILVPQRLALALQADGWTVRSVAPWLRRAAMPESVTDRPSSALSWVIMLAKGPRYFWDAEAVRQPHTDPRVIGGRYVAKGGVSLPDYVPSEKDGLARPVIKMYDRNQYNPAGRSMRNTDPFYDSLDLAIEQAAADLARLKALRASGGVLADCDGVPMALDVNPEPSRLEHFAAWPSRLIRPWILAACPERVCAVCGKGWVRVTETIGTVSYGAGVRKRADAPGAVLSQSSAFRTGQGAVKGTVGFRAACDHEADTLPGTVLDIFSGSGTTLLTANRLGRRGLGIDLSAEYADMARRRLERDAPMMNAIQEAEREPARQLEMFA